jgi:hypothetical protein
MMSRREAATFARRPKDDFGRFDNSVQAIGALPVKLILREGQTGEKSIQLRDLTSA